MGDRVVPLSDAVMGTSSTLQAEAIGEHVQIRGVGVSARLDEGPESIENLLTRAEEAMALAKQRGRNRVVAPRKQVATSA